MFVHDDDGLGGPKTAGIQTYNGIYNKQQSTINGYDWWVARNDVGDTNDGTNATVYFSTSHNRWVIEAPDVYWEANITQHSFAHGDLAATQQINDGDDRRRFSLGGAFDQYFGRTNWFQFSMNYGSTTVESQSEFFDNGTKFSREYPCI